MQSYSSYYLGFLLITEILLWLPLKKSTKKEKARVWIAVSNLYTFVYTEWVYVHATHCHTLGKEEVLQMGGGGHVSWLVCETVVCLNTRCLEGWLCRAVSGSNGDGGKQQRVWGLQVLLSVSAQFHRLHDGNNHTTQPEAESGLSFKRPGPDAGSTPLNTVLSYSYLKSQDWLRSHYRLMWCIKVCPMQDLNQLDIFLFFQQQLFHIPTVFTT